MGLIKSNQIEAGGADGVVSVPTGAMLPHAGGSVPTAYLLCDGSSLATATHPDLFAVLGYTYGGAGANFNLPDTRGRSCVGVGTGPGLTARARGDTGGFETHTLTTAQLPSHSHLQPAVAGIGEGDGGGPRRNGPNTQAAGFTGGDGAHNNMQPFMVVTYIVKT